MDNLNESDQSIQSDDDISYINNSLNCLNRIMVNIALRSDNTCQKHSADDICMETASAIDLSDQIVKLLSFRKLFENGIIPAILGSENDDDNEGSDEGSDEGCIY